MNKQSLRLAIESLNKFADSITTTEASTKSDTSGIKITDQIGKIYKKLKNASTFSTGVPLSLSVIVNKKTQRKSVFISTPSSMDKTISVSMTGEDKEKKELGKFKPTATLESIVKPVLPVDSTISVVQGPMKKAFGGKSRPRKGQKSGRARTYMDDWKVFLIENPEIASSLNSIKGHYKINTEIMFNKTAPFNSGASFKQFMSANKPDKNGRLTAYKNIGNKNGQVEVLKDDLKKRRQIIKMDPRAISAKGFDVLYRWNKFLSQQVSHDRQELIKKGKIIMLPAWK